MAATDRTSYDVGATDGQDIIRRGGDRWTGHNTTWRRQADRTSYDVVATDRIGHPTTWRQTGRTSYDVAAKDRTSYDMGATDGQDTLRRGGDRRT